MSIEALTWAWKQKTGSPGRKAVLMVLADKADEEHSCYPGQAHIAALSELSERTVRGHLADLEEAGYLRREKRYRADGTRTSDRYYLAVNGVKPTQELPAKSAAGLPANPVETTGENCRVTQREQPKEVLLPLQLEEPQPAVTQHTLPAFVAFYEAYPRKKERQKALAAYVKAVKAGAAPDKILAGAQAYARSVEHTDPKFVKYPASWLNAGCWDDELEPPPTVRPTGYPAASYSPFGSL